MHLPTRKGRWGRSRGSRTCYPGHLRITGGMPALRKRKRHGLAFGLAGAGENGTPRTTIARFDGPTRRCEGSQKVPRCCVCAPPRPPIATTAGFGAILREQWATADGVWIDAALIAASSDPWHRIPGAGAVLTASLPPGPSNPHHGGGRGRVNSTG